MSILIFLLSAFKLIKDCKCYLIIQRQWLGLTSVHVYSTSKVPVTSVFSVIKNKCFKSS